MPITKQIYPSVQSDNPVEKPPDPDLIKTFRLSCITQIQRDLEQDLSKYNRTKRRYSSAFNTFTYLNAGATTAASISSATSIGLFATGFATPVALPLSVVSLGLGLSSFALSCANKKVKAKLQKHTAIVQLATAKLSSFRLIISKALEDSNITDEEFNRLQADYDDYKRQKFDLQKKSRANFSQSHKAEEIKKECLKQVNETLNSLLKN